MVRDCVVTVRTDSFNIRISQDGFNEYNNKDSKFYYLSKN